MRDIVDIQIIDACRLAMRMEGDDSARLLVIAELLAKAGDREPDDSAYPAFFEAVKSAGASLQVVS